MAVVTTTFGSSATSLAVTALNSLASSAFWKSAAIDFTVNDPVSVIFQVKISTANSGAGSATGYLNVYLACSNDNSVYDGTITAGDATWTTTAPATAESLKSLQLLGRISHMATATTTNVLTKTFFLPAGTVPKYAVVVIENGTGKGLLGSGNSVTYLENTYTIT